MCDILVDSAVMMRQRGIRLLCRMRFILDKS